MYVSRLAWGRPGVGVKDLPDLLRLTLAAVEVSATRREALDAVSPERRLKDPRLPDALESWRHTVYETSVVYEFSQLARSDFEAHGNTALWERPILNPVTNRTQNIDMSLFRKGAATSVLNWATDERFGPESEIETRIEFGKFDGRLWFKTGTAGKQRLKMSGGQKLRGDARKLHRLSGTHDAGPAPEGLVDPRIIENFVVLWKELDSRVDGPLAQFTRHRAAMARAAGAAYAKGVSRSLRTDFGDPAFEVKLSAAAACSLSTYEDDVHRSAYAWIFSLPTDTPNNRAREVRPRAEVRS